nr:phosphate-starvation-inducible PsiE family protein [Anaerofilum sp. An201]
MRSKEAMRRKIAFMASVLEIVISALVLVAIVIAGVRTVGEVAGIAFSSNVADDFNTVLGHALNLVIGVEFIKMLAKHTPGSAIEVLVFAIARQMVVQHTTPLENLITIVTIGLLFFIRKFLFVSSFGAHRPDEGEGTESEPAAPGV